MKIFTEIQIGQPDSDNPLSTAQSQGPALEAQNRSTGYSFDNSLQKVITDSKDVPP